MSSSCPTELYAILDLVRFLNLKQIIDKALFREFYNQIMSLEAE